MSTIGNIFQQTNPYENFVRQLVTLESQTKFRLQVQESAQQEKKSALGAVSSSISSFISNIEELQQPDNKALRPFRSSVSDKDVVNVTSVSGVTNPGEYNITVDRLATNDTALSQLMNGEDTNLSTFGDGSVTITVGDQTETISIETSYEDDQGNTVQRTNREILELLSDRINTSLGDSVTASLFRVNDQQVQFSLKSADTGTDHQLQFNGASGALAEVFDNMNHLVPQDQLNALFTIDGVSFERSGNTVSDAINGMEFELKKATGEQETMTVSRDITKARNNIKSFISSFNEMNQTIRDRTFIDAENNRRGALQDMRSIRNLTLNLRQTGLLSSEAAAEGELSRFAEIGIGFENNGSMVIEDTELLNQMLEERPDEVESLFVNEQSPVSLMKTQAEAYTKSGSGIINTLQEGVDQRIERLENRIESQEKYLERYEEEQRAIFNELQLIVTQAQSQYNQVLNFRNSIGA